MTEIPADLKYSRDHEWVRDEGDGTCVVGITDHAQAALGELVFIEVPEVDTEVELGDTCATVESVKAASDVYSPLTGQVIEVNEKLSGSPQLVNEDPYGDGWLFRLRIENAEEFDELLSSDDYEQLLEDNEGDED
jgi:glycine cleavage system H protein